MFPNRVRLLLLVCVMLDVLRLVIASRG